MKVVCFCGHEYVFYDEIGPCPNCERVAAVNMTEDEAKYRLDTELEEILDKLLNRKR